MIKLYKENDCVKGNIVMNHINNQDDLYNQLHSSCQKYEQYKQNQHTMLHKLINTYINLYYGNDYNILVMPGTSYTKDGWLTKTTIFLC